MPSRVITTSPSSRSGWPDVAPEDVVAHGRRRRRRPDEAHDQRRGGRSGLVQQRVHRRDEGVAESLDGTRRGLEGSRIAEGRDDRRSGVHVAGLDRVERRAADRPVVVDQEARRRRPLGRVERPERAGGAHPDRHVGRALPRSGPRAPAAAGPARRRLPRGRRAPAAGPPGRDRGSARPGLRRAPATTSIPRARPRAAPRARRHWPAGHAPLPRGRRSLRTRHPDRGVCGGPAQRRARARRRGRARRPPTSRRAHTRMVTRISRGEGGGKRVDDQDQHA